MCKSKRPFLLEDGRAFCFYCLRYYAASAQGSITILVTFSFLSRQISYIFGASYSVMRCEIKKLGSI